MTKQKILIWFFATLSRSLTLILSRFSTLSNRGLLWRIACLAILREIRYRNGIMKPSVLPFKRFERYFAHDYFYLERFQNLVAGHRVLVNLLDIDWFRDLRVKDRVLVTALFRRIVEAENVYYTYRNRQDLNDNLYSLENVDQDSLPKEIFLPKPISPLKSASVGTTRTPVLASVTGYFVSIPKAVLQFIFFIVLAVFLLAFTVITIPFKGLSALGIHPDGLAPARAFLQRIELSIYQRVGLNQHHIAHIVSRYETEFGSRDDAMQALAQLMSKPHFEGLLSTDFIDNIPLNDRVLNMALLRRMASYAGSNNLQLRLKQLDPALNVKNQRDVAQLTRPNRFQKNEIKFFRSMSDMKVAVPSETQNGELPKTQAATSEILLRQAGWFAKSRGPEWEFCEAVRRRSMHDIMNMGNDGDKFLALPSQFKNALGALFILNDLPLTASMKSNFSFDKTFLVPLDRETNKTRLVRAQNTAREILHSYEAQSGTNPLRTSWLRLQASQRNEAAFPGHLERLLQKYKTVPVTRITLRSVSFDTFLITDLDIILAKAETWLDWEELTTSMLAVLACAAALAGHSQMFKTAFAYLSETRISKAYLSNLQSSYLSIGFHALPHIGHEADKFSDPVTDLDPKKKYLCLVEAVAQIRPLRQLSGVADNVVCAPVIPADAPRYPEGTTLKQIEDFIPMYCAEDMEIAAGIDTMVQSYLEIARQKLKESGFDERKIEAVEVAHATVFFAGYRDALGARVSEKLISKAGDYDGILLIMRNGHTLGRLVQKAAKAVGRKNVLISMETERISEIKDIVSEISGKTPDAGTKTPAKAQQAENNWEEKLSSWIGQVTSTHEQALSHKKAGSYALLCLEHINGYFDSYVALAKESLRHFNVEMFVSRANKQLNDFIVQGGFRPFETKNRFSQSRLAGRFPPAREWTVPLSAKLKEAAENIKSPWLKQYKQLFLNRFETVFSQRYPQILDAVCYFEKRFEISPPEFVFTGPNQHMISRAASYAALARNIPVYDFLILANTDHPRYRPPVASQVYLYDPWYEDIYTDFMGMSKNQIRTSGPLFDYGERLKHIGETSGVDKSKTHIVFFSQSANFINSQLMLEGICGAISGRDDVFLTIKMHPHESPANIERYRTLVGHKGVTTNLQVIHHGDSVALINEADLVVQSFSNTGLDALLMETPVITFKPKTALRARIFLYEKEIGFVVKTKAALTKKIKSFLENPEDLIEMQSMAQQFAKENAHFLRNDNAERVMKEVLNDVDQSAAA